MVQVRRLFVCVLLAGFLAAAAPPASAATRCGIVNTQRGVWTITKAQNVTCRSAKSLVRRIQAHKDQPRGWRCQGGTPHPVLNCGGTGNRLVSAERGPSPAPVTCPVGEYGNGTPLTVRWGLCSTAGRVAVASWANAAACIEGCVARGFRCRGTPGSVEGGEMICRRGKAVVRYGYGG